MGYVIEPAKGIEINGKVYPCDPGDYMIMHGIMYHFPQIVEKLQHGKILEAKLRQAMARGADPVETAPLRDEADRVQKDVIEASIHFIEGTLGKDEYKELFGDKRVNMMRLVDLCAHIFEWANADRAEVMADYLVLPENRATRRKKKKKKKGAPQNVVADTTDQDLRAPD